VRRKTNRDCPRDHSVPDRRRASSPLFDTEKLMTTIGNAAMSERQTRFVSEFLIDQNGTQAAIRAGYSPRTAKAQASRLLTKVNVAEAIEAGQRAIAERAAITADRVMQQLGRLGFGDLRRAFKPDGSLKRPDEWDDDTAAFISSIEVVTTKAGEGEVEHVAKIRSADKRAALADIARALGMFKDTLEVKHIGAALLASPQWEALRGAVLRALEPFPEARAAVVQALADALS
jgi:phage terminase small subunit